MSRARVGLAIALLLGAWSAVALPQEARGQTVAFDNFPGNAYSNGGTWMGSGFNEVMFSATAFTPTASGQITHLDVGMFLEPTPPVPNELTMYVLTSIGAVPPTTSSIWSQTYDGVLKNGFGSVTSLPVSNGPEITAGTRYWLYVEVPVTGAFTPNYQWYDGLAGSNATAFYFSQSATRPQTWHIFDPPVDPGRALRVTVAGVPEPTGCLPLALGVCFLLRRGTRAGRGSGATSEVTVSDF